MQTTVRLVSGVGTLPFLPNALFSLPFYLRLYPVVRTRVAMVFHERF